MTTPNSAGCRNPLLDWLGSRRPGLLILLLLTAQAGWFACTLATWLDEGDYLYKSTALIRHGLTLYSEALPSWYTPLYYLALGCWQEIMGLGLLSGRLLSVCCYLISLGILASAMRRIFPEARRPFVWLGCLVLLTPSIALFQSSVTQFAFVNLQVSGLIWVMFAWPNERWRWWAAGLLTGAIAMTRPNLLLAAPLLPLLVLWLRGWPGWRPPLQYLAAWLLADAFIAAAFGPGALWNLIRAFPGGDALAQWTGLTRTGWVGTLNGTDLGLKLFDWWTYRPETFRGAHLYFLDGYLWPYLLLVSSNLATLFFWRQSGYRRGAEAGFALLFLWSSLVHFAGTQTFCPTCAHAYMNYSTPLGLIGGVPMVWRLARFLQAAWLRSTAPRAWIGAAAGLPLAAYFALGWVPQGAYWKWHAPEMAGQVSQIARALQTQVPESAVVLPLGEDIRLTEAIHAAGRLADPVLINYHFSQREPIDPLRRYSPREESLIRRRGLWTKELLREWLATRFDYVIVRKGSIPYKAHLAILEAHYHLEPLLPGLPESDPLSGYTIARRVPPPRIAVHGGS